ncbi:MAG: flavodoxin [Methanomethylophilus sp.]|nr:flavodoxin [Methanomethylophilus sp.]MDD4221703.1 flavodoxin [Methanomethylophilus sp.]MDD4668275.1 flavodoxin [Methanomethylophilus sp.]
MSDIAVVYYSRAGENCYSGAIRNVAVGNTEVVVGYVRDLTGADLFKLETVEKYPVNYTQCTDRAKAELHANARPALQSLPHVTAYQTVILAFPNWWGTAPMAVRTFLDAQTLAGKKVLLLCTNEGGGMGSSERDLKQACPEASFGPSLEIRGGAVTGAKDKVERWLKKARLL